MRLILFYTVGYPGSGKTTLARSLAHWLNTTHLRGDKIGLELFRFPTFSPQERAVVYSEMIRQSREVLQSGNHVLYDASVNTLAQRDQLRTLAEQHGAVAVGLFVNTPMPLAKQRAAKIRDLGVGQPVARVIPPHVFDQIIVGFEPPQQHEDIITVAGDLAFPIQYHKIRMSLGRSGHTVLPRLVSN